MSYSEPPPPPPQYGAPVPPAGGVPQKNNGKAIWSLVLGIVSVVCGCSILAGIPAIILGNMAKKEIDAGQGTGRGMAQAGYILGIIGVVLGVLWIILYATGVLEFSGSASTS
ncbi:DUF4190 domain-containing protein [Nocardioides sp.]|uniref:DUF4190 domain-containing protein n=1 Tax=Nocardioides sp. TaxID=35761 RepID=UPI00378308B9